MKEEEIKEIEKNSKIANEKIEKNKVDKREKTYTKDEVLKMFQEFKKELAKEEVNDDTEDKTIQRKVRISRFNNKFIVGLKNLNTDEYDTEKVVYSQDIFDEKTRSYVPHITVIFDDESELTVPLETILKLAVRVDCDLIETKEVKNDEKLGYVEQKELKGDGYDMTTGDFVMAVQKKSKYTYLVKLPNKDEPIEVIQDIINW